MLVQFYNILVRNHVAKDIYVFVERYICFEQKIYMSPETKGPMVFVFFGKAGFSKCDIPFARKGYHIWSKGISLSKKDGDNMVLHLLDFCRCERCIASGIGRWYT